MLYEDESFARRALKNELQVASRLEAHNLNGKFCKFCAHEFEIIGVFSFKKENTFKNINKTNKSKFYINFSMLSMVFKKHILVFDISFAFFKSDAVQGG